MGRVRPNKMNEKRTLLAVSIVAVTLLVVTVLYFQHENRTVLRLHPKIIFVGDTPTYGAVHDIYLTISNEGGREIHNVYVEYEPWGMGWDRPEERVFFGDIPVGENRTERLKDFYVPRDAPYVRYPVFYVIADEGTIRITTDEFHNKDWRFDS